MVELLALGPLEARRDGEPVALGGPKQRTVLALLVAGRGHAVSDDALIDGVWGGDTGSRGTLQTYVSNLRHALGEGTIVRVDEGYRLALSPDDVDVWRFERAVRDGEDLLAERPEEGAAKLRAALDLWRGRPYGGTEEAEALDADARHLAELRLAAIEDRIEAELAIGRDTGLVTELSTLADDHPTRERLQGLHMKALYRAGRQADALEVFDRTRRFLAEELGIDPSPDLRELHRRILSQDPHLLGRPAEAADRPRTVTAPSGQVTFLFTDIEGSTRLFHALGDEYAPLLARHREILADAWEDHGGYEVGVEGDGSLVAFGSAADAGRAAVAAQHALASADWPDGVEVKVRMGMHTGLAWPRDGNYVSLVVHEAARVMAAAHGGQVVLSQETAERLGDPSGVVVRSLGRFRLRGFEQPVRLYELQAEGSPSDFGPPRATPAEGHNLVRQPTETIGREPLVAEVAELVEAGTLVTLVGTGGVGKTRVASEVGMAVADAWKDGVWFADLAPVTDPGLVAAAVAEAVAAPRGPGRDRVDDLVAHLAPRRCVVILDNCEHVLVACRELIDRLLARCDELALLATSREPLHQPGERLRPVGPLDLPEPGETDPGRIRAASAGRLFEQRGAAVRPGFTIDADNAADVGAICRLLDGLPLLVELSAALLPMRSPREIRTALEERAQPLRSRDPLAVERHRSLEDLIDWSYRLLDADERAAFRRLSVFGASFSLETAGAAVAVGGLDRFDVARLVWSLVERSLVTADLTANETRYRLLETIRRDARRRLDAADETALVASSLCRALLERLGPWLPTEWRWVAEVGTELDNLRALVPLLPTDDEERAQQIACSIGRYHDATQSFQEGIAELQRYVDVYTRPTSTRVSLLARLADLQLRTGDADAAEELVAAAAELAEQHGAPPWDDVAVERVRGEIARRRGDLPHAIEVAELTLRGELSDRGRSRMYNLLGTTLAAAGDLEQAREALAEELALNRRVGYEAGISASHANLAEVALRLGDLEQAAHHQRACLELALEQGSPAMIAFSLIVAARLAGSRDDWEAAARLHARAEVMLDEIGLTLYEDDQRESDRLMTDAHAELGADPFRDVTAAGRGMPLVEAAQLADAVFAAMEPPPVRIEAPDESVGANT